MDNNRRRLVRHIDGRLMIMNLTFKNFIIITIISLMLLPIFVSLFKALKNPFVFLIASVVIGAMVLALGEVNNKETGIDIFKNFMRYKREGELIFERGDINNESTDIRFTRNKVEKQESGADF